MKTAEEWADEFREVAKDRPSAMGATLECLIRDAMEEAAEQEKDRCLAIVGHRTKIWREAAIAGVHEDCAMSLWEECEDIGAAIVNGLDVRTPALTQPTHGPAT